MKDDNPIKEKGGLILAKYIEIGRLAIKEINIALHERLMTAKEREKNVKNTEIPITIGINIPTLNTSYNYYKITFLKKQRI